MLPILPNLGKENRESVGTPQRLINIHKDDISVQEVGVRTPLQRLNRQRGTGTSISKAQYSQITPFQTPVAKTPKRKSATSRPGQLKFTEQNDDTKQGSVKSSNGATSTPMLNSLVYKEVMQIVKEKEDEKHKEIQSLHDFYKSCLKRIEENKQAAVEISTQTEHDDDPVPEVKVGQEFQFSDMSTLLLETPPDGSRQTDSGCSPIRFDGGEEASYINAVDMETWMTPVKTLDMSQVTSPIVQVDKALETKIETADADTATDVVQTISRSAMTVPPEVKEESVGTEHKEYSDSQTSVTPVKYSHTSTTYTPVKLMETETFMTPVQHRTMTTQKTPVRSVAMETAMTPVHHATIETAMTPVHHVSGWTEMTPVKQITMATDMTPLKQVTMATDMTPVKLHSEGVGTEAVDNHEVGVSTTPVQMTDCETTTTPIKTKDAAMRTEPVDQLEKEVNTSPTKTTTICTMVTPVKTCNSETNMSPMKLIDVAISTDALPASQDACTQISTDHEDCVDKQYKKMFQQTRQKLRETEVQLEAFLRLKDGLVEVNALQDVLHEKLGKARDTLNRKREKYENEHNQWIVEHQEWQQCIGENETKMKELTEERDKMAATYYDILQGKCDAEKALKQECNEHTQTQEKLDSVSQELSETRSSHNRMKDTFSAMKMQMDELVKTLEENVVQMEAMKAELQLVQDNMAAEESRADFAESQLHNLVQRHEQEMTKLHHLLKNKEEETREQEIQLRTRLRSTIDSKDFLEQENQVMREDLFTAQRTIGELHTKIAGAKDEIESRVKESVELTNENNQLQRMASTLQDELDHTKASAHLLLLDQNTEISQTIQRLDALSELVCHLDQQIEENVTEWSTLPENSFAEEKISREEAIGTDTVKTRKSQDRRSLVATIMEAIHNIASPSEQTSQPCFPTQGEQNSENECSSDAVAQVPQIVIGSEGRAFERVQPLSQNEADANETSQNSTSEQDSEHSEGESSSIGDRSQMKPLFEQVNDVRDMVSNVIGNLKVLKDAVHQKMSSLQSRINQLESESKSSQKDQAHVTRKQTDKIRDLSLQIKDLEGINKDLKEALNRSRDLMPQKAQEKCKKLEGELDKVYQKLKNQTEENKILSDLLNSKLEECSDESQKNLVKENAALKKDLQRWKVRFYKEQEGFDSKISKLKLTAQQEIETYHSAYQDLRKIIMKHSVVAMLWPERDALEDLGALDSPGSSTSPELKK